MQEEQAAASFLREQFLKLIGNKLPGKQCCISMYENTEVECKIKSINPNFENIIVDNLKTPQPATIACAILRTSDVISITL